ncbi:MAG TPA: cytochrome c [Steroidobacteraceae bacterium]|nr:cytochrome c [Steroidobacteraceae bacterium]
MDRKAVLSGIGAALWLAAGLWPSGVRADDQDVIDYRQHVMSTLGDQMLLIEQIIQKKAPADDLNTFARILAMDAALAPSAFKPDVAGGKSKPNVWTNWADFSRQLDALAARAADLQQAAKTGDLAAVAAKAAALDCMGCHATYMQAK